MALAVQRAPAQMVSRQPQALAVTAVLVALVLMPMDPPSLVLPVEMVVLAALEALAVLLAVVIPH